MRLPITIRYKLEVPYESIIPLIQSGDFLEGKIELDDIPFYLFIGYNEREDGGASYTIYLNGQSEFFEDSCVVDTVHAKGLVEYLNQFYSNPYQFAENYGH